MSHACTKPSNGSPSYLEQNPKLPQWPTRPFILQPALSLPSHLLPCSSLQTPLQASCWILAFWQSFKHIQRTAVCGLCTLCSLCLVCFSSEIHGSLLLHIGLSSNATSKERSSLSTYLKLMRDFPGGPVVRIPRFHCRGYRFEPWSGI